MNPDADPIIEYSPSVATLGLLGCVVSNSIISGRVDGISCGRRVQRSCLDAAVALCRRRPDERRRPGHVVRDDQMNAEQQDHERAVQKVRQARHDTDPA